MSKRSNLTLLSGHRGCGKKEYVEKLKKKLKFTVISFDDTAIEMYQKLTLTNEEKRNVMKSCMDKLYQSLENEENIFFIDVFQTRMERIEVVRAVRNYCVKHAIRCWITCILYPYTLTYCKNKMTECEREVSEMLGETIEMVESFEGFNNMFMWLPSKSVFKQIKFHDKYVQTTIV